jgi:aminotransferase
MTTAETKVRTKPDIRAITRLVPPDGNLVQGQSELAIDPQLARAAAEVIAASQNHYSPAEGAAELRRALAEKVNFFNGVSVDAGAQPLELLVTPGGTGGLVAVARTHLVGASALVFEPYYPYHRRIVEELGGRTETLALERDSLTFDREELRARCRELKGRRQFPLRAVVCCTPVNPTGKVFTRDELSAIAEVCQEFDLLCIADEVYEHYVDGAHPHTSIASLPGMWERTVTCNSFSKSWNISGWRLGYAYGAGALVAPLFNALNVFYVCSPTPLQKALAQVLMADPGYYARLREKFSADATQRVAHQQGGRGGRPRQRVRRHRPLGQFHARLHRARGRHPRQRARQTPARSRRWRHGVTGRLAALRNYSDARRHAAARSEFSLQAVFPLCTLKREL